MRARFRRLAPGRRCADRQYRRPLSLGAVLSRATIERWTGARTVLLGDACHPMLPFMAQGAVMAIEDGLVLARCLARDGIADPAAAFCQYERERVERANRCVRAAERNRVLSPHSTRQCQGRRALRRDRMERAACVRPLRLAVLRPCDGEIRNRYRPEYVRKLRNAVRRSGCPFRERAALLSRSRNA